MLGLQGAWVARSPDGLLAKCTADCRLIYAACCSALVCNWHSFTVAARRRPTSGNSVTFAVPARPPTCLLMTRSCPGRRRRCDATTAKSLCDHSKCTELTLEQHDFDECSTPQPAGRLNVGYFQVETRPFVL
jgi:hypothetical protein